MIKIATLNELNAGGVIDKKAKKVVPDNMPNLKSTIAENTAAAATEVQFTPSKYHYSFINFATHKEARELNLAKENITGITAGVRKWLDNYRKQTRWPQLMRQRNYNVIQIGIRAMCIDKVVTETGKTWLRLEEGTIVSQFLSILYGKDYNENYLLIETDPIKTDDGGSYRTFKEYDRPAGVVRFWAISTESPLSKSVKRIPMSKINGGIDVWNYREELGIDFLPVSITWNDEYGNPTLKYQSGMISNLSELVDDILPNWVSTRSNYNVNELYMRSQANAANAFAKELKSKERTRSTKTNSNKYISEVSIIEGDPKIDALMTSMRKLRAIILEEAELDVTDDSQTKQKNDNENHREQRDPKKMLMDKAVLRSFDDTILWDRVLIIATKLGLVKGYKFNSIKIDYDLGFIVSEKLQLELKATSNQQQTPPNPTNTPKKED